MAYKNLISVSCNNPIETFMRFRDFVCANNGTVGTYDYSTTGIGWTYHDSSYTVGGSKDTPGINDYFVIYSTGESGTRRLYYKVTLISNYIYVEGYLYWDNSTHTGNNRFVASSSWFNTTATNNILWIYGDLDKVKGITKYGSAYYQTDFGCIPDSWVDQTVSTVTAAITAGSPVTVTFSATIPVSWVIGTKLIVRDTVYIEQVTITNISGNDVTFASFAHSYLAGSRFSFEHNNYVTTYVSNVSNYYFLINHAGTLSQYSRPESWLVEQVTGAEGLNGNYISKICFVGSANSLFGPLKNQYSTISTLTPESLHDISGVSYRFFSVYYLQHILVKEV